MLQRIVGIATVVAGLLAVAGLVVIGIDVCAAAKRGPRWRRRMLAAGLALLGLVGVAQHGCMTTTCYEPISVDPSETPTGKRLEQQMRLLLPLASEDRLDPEVVRKALAAAEAALEDVCKEDVGKVSPDERVVAEELRLEVRQKMECVRARLEGGPRPLADSSDWQKLTAILDEAMAVAEGKMGSYPFDKAGQKRLLSETDEAEHAVERLVAAKLLTEAESSLIREQLVAAAHGVRDKRPVEEREATCYKPMVISGRHPALRLQDRLPLLEKMAAEERLDPSVLRRVLVSVEADLAEAEADPQSAEVRDAVKTQIKKLKALAGASQ